MKFLLYGLNFWPELTGVGKYTGEMADWLCKEGHEVRVITSVPYYPAWQIPREYSLIKYYHEEKGGINITRCPLYAPSRPSGGKRLVHLASFGLSSFPALIKTLRSWRPNLIFTVEPTLFSALQAILAARLVRLPAWLHVQDFEIDAAFNLGILSFRPLRKMALFLERLLMKRFSCVSTITYRMVEHLERKGVLRSRQILFPNWVDTDLIRPLSYPSPFRRILGIPDDHLVALVSGTLGEKQGMEIIIESAKILLEKPRIRFIFCGEGPMLPTLKMLSGNLRNVSFLPLQPLEKLNDLLNLADIHLLPQKSGVADLVMPSKLSGMLASARPVVATADPCTQVHAVTRNCGICVPPGNAVEFSKGIETLAEQSAKRSILGAAGREYALKFLEKNTVLRNFVDDVEKLFIR